MTDKPLNVTNTAEATSGSDVEVYGDPDQWVLLCKASSKKQGWMKSTKAMNLGSAGCLVQVSTQQGDNTAEALTYVPNVHVVHGNSGPVLVTSGE